MTFHFPSAFLEGYGITTRSKTWRGGQVLYKTSNITFKASLTLTSGPFPHLATIKGIHNNVADVPLAQAYDVMSWLKGPFARSPDVDAGMSRPSV